MLIYLACLIYMFSKFFLSVSAKLIPQNIIFHQRAIVINKITTNSGTNYEKYYIAFTDRIYNYFHFQRELF